MSHTSRRRKAARQAVLSSQLSGHDLGEALARLGLPPDATPDEVRDAVTALRSHQARASVPPAPRKVALTGSPDLDSAGPDPVRVTSVEAVDADDAVDELERELIEVDEPALVGVQPDPFDGLLDDDSDRPLFRRRTPRTRPVALAAPAQPSTAATPVRRSARPRERRLTRSPLLLVAVTILTAILVVVVHQAGQPQQPAANPHATGMPTVMASAQPTAAATPRAVDEAKVTELKAKVSANPADVVSLIALGDEYSKAGQAEQAKTWHAKAVAVAPTNVDARLALGVDHYNLGDLPAAEAEWTEVVRLDPNQAEAWFNLGFLHFSKNPPDLAAVQTCWNKVIQLAPNSEMASVVRGHLNRLNANPSASPSR